MQYDGVEYVGGEGVPEIYIYYTYMYYKRIYIECLTTSIMSPALAALGDWSSGRRMRSGAPITLPLPVLNNDSVVR